MEKHIFKFGNTSMALVLPKSWVDKNGLKNSDSVFVRENSKGELVLGTERMEKSPFVKSIDKSTDPDILARFVGLYYMRGVGKLTIHARDGITDKQVLAIQEKINNECPGFEIISQSSNQVVIEDFTNIKEIDLDKLISRLRSLVMQEFDEVIHHNTETVARLEEMVDRFYKLGIRYISLVQPSDTLKYYRTVIIIEDIADDLHLISEKLDKNQNALVKELKVMFEMSEKGFNGDQRAILELAIKKKRLRAPLRNAKLDDVYKRVMNHIGTCCNRIAEFGLLEEDPRLAIDKQLM
jgi:phosphate uptake regulator